MIQTSSQRAYLDRTENRARRSYASSMRQADASRAEIMPAVVAAVMLWVLWLAALGFGITAVLDWIRG